ncbi:MULTISPECIES: SCO family protein [unclassified Duganella]|uniref:SCO family protein n=1 Tax=unclassified Duganella TaxID=2636909 RepID=UPI000E349FB7|nr:MULTISPECIES: SCO family protein [unclassified Duganella]RFP19401.1 SCO family protein [Duganella sp. BJB475]RFP35982.1 SCO family protein [Duganella sp. BJB476]
MKISTSSNSSSLCSTLIALALVCATGVAALYYGTMGFEVVSTEDGRRLAVSRQPLDLPAAAIHQPQAATLARMLGEDGRIAIVTFFYSSCNAVCSVLGNELQQMQDEIRKRGLQHDVRLVSISFDPRDSSPVLADYARRLHADPALWRMVSVDREEQRKALLDAFGIVVLPAPLGEFQHNAAFHLIDRQGRLARIDDYDDPAQALEDAVQLARTSARGGRP